MLESIKEDTGSKLMYRLYSLHLSFQLYSRVANVDIRKSPCTREGVNCGLTLRRVQVASTYGIALVHVSLLTCMLSPTYMNIYVHSRFSVYVRRIHIRAFTLAPYLHFACRRLYSHNLII